MKTLFAFAALLVSVAAFGQTSPSPFNTFSMNLAPVSLPGNHQTVAGTAAGADLTLTPNFDVGNLDIIAPGQNFQYFAGHFNRRIPQLANYFNNHSTQNMLKFQFGVTGSVGIDRLTATGRQHFGATGGGFVNYSLGGGRYSLGAEVQYAKFPGLANNTFIVSLDPAIHF